MRRSTAERGPSGPWSNGDWIVAALGGESTVTPQQLALIEVATRTRLIWRPSPEHPLDLEATVEQELRDLHARYNVCAILCDPFQLHRSITTLTAAGLPISEFPQTTGNTTQMGQVPFDLLRGHNLRLYASEELRARRRRVHPELPDRQGEVGEEDRRYRRPVDGACRRHRATAGAPADPSRIVVKWFGSDAHEGEPICAVQCQRDPPARPWKSIEEVDFATLELGQMVERA